MWGGRRGFIKHRRRLVSSHPLLVCLQELGLLTQWDQGKWREIHPLTYSSLYFGRYSRHIQALRRVFYGVFFSFRAAIFAGRGYSQVLPNSSSRLARKASAIHEAPVRGKPPPGLPWELALENSHRDPLSGAAGMDIELGTWSLDIARMFVEKWN